MKARRCAPSKIVRRSSRKPLRRITGKKLQRITDKKLRRVRNKVVRRISGKQARWGRKFAQIGTQARLDAQRSYANLHKVLTMSEAASRLRVTKATLSLWVRHGLPVKRNGSNLFVRPVDLVAWVHTIWRLPKVVLRDLIYVRSKT